MKKHGMVLYMLEDKAEVRGQMINLSTTSAGHYLLPLNSDIKSGKESCLAIEDVFAIDLRNTNLKDKTKALEKLHKQFGHRPKQSFVNLLKAADVYTEDMPLIIDNIISGCEGCIKRKRNPDKPAVSMPMAKDFNEKVTIEIKIWNGQYLLYIIDMWSRL